MERNTVVDVKCANSLIMNKIIYFVKKKGLFITERMLQNLYYSNYYTTSQFRNNKTDQVDCINFYTDLVRNKLG